MVLECVFGKCPLVAVIFYTLIMCAHCFEKVIIKFRIQDETGSKNFKKKNCLTD